MITDAEVQRVVRSKFFDAEFYAEAAGMSFAVPAEAARHYLERGWQQGFSPSVEFDTRYYLSKYRDVAAAFMQPLLHYLDFGAREGRRPRLTASPPAPNPTAPPAEAWARLASEGRAAGRERSAQADDAASVDVVVPVYRGYDDTLACLHSVLVSANATPFRLIVVDDCSPEPALSEALERLAALGLITLLRNETNLGFVATVNRAMALSRNRDVLLLNADTEVHGDWLDRLRRHARGQEQVATVTPLSNNATIFSYPFINQNNYQQLELGFEALDALCAAVHPGRSVEVPTGVGFCFYMTRAGLDALGPFDERLFGKGYGEENDYCFRALENAWRNLAALDVFVRHTGEISFASSAATSKAAGGRRLNAVHPRYDRLIRDHIKRDPLASARAALDVARFARLSRGRGVLMVEHGWGGGVGCHVEDLARLLAREGVPSLVWRPASDGGGLTLTPALPGQDFPNLPETRWEDLRRSVQLLRDLDLGRVHLHSLAAVPLESFEALTEAIREAGLAYDFTLHDYTPVCPRVDMRDWGGGYCDSPSSAYCQICVDRAGTRFGPVRMEDWRQAYGRILAGARRVLSPSQDAAERTARYFPQARPIQVRPHPPRVVTPAPAPPPRPGDERLRTVGVIGGIGEHKGSQILRSAAADALVRRLPLRFVIYGHTSLTDLERFPNVTVTGRFEERNLDRLVAEQPCDLALFPSIWPETFCYALDHAFRLGIIPVVFDLGAPADRIRATGFGEVLPFGTIYDPAALNDRLLALEPAGPEGPIMETGRAWVSAGAYYDLEKLAGSEPQFALRRRPRTWSASQT